MPHQQLTALAFTLLSIFSGPVATQQPAPPTVEVGHDPSLNAVLWTQHAAEHRALCRQVFNCAKAVLDQAKEDPRWTAALEQSGQDGIGELPPAIIVDVDETVLDNSPHQARLVHDGAEFSGSRTWTPWVQEQQAQALPGAVEFLNHAAREGITVFYVTNRSHEVEAETRANLARLGFPLSDSTDVDVVLTLQEQESFGPDKTTRRSFVARSFRILMLFGDDLGDFMPGVRVGQDVRHQTPASVQRHGVTLEAERADRVDEFAEWFGTRWFVLPNVLYGSWLDVARAEATTGVAERTDPVTGKPVEYPTFDFRSLLLTRRIEPRTRDAK